MMQAVFHPQEEESSEISRVGCFALLYQRSSNCRWRKDNCNTNNSVDSFVEGGFYWGKNPICGHAQAVCWRNMMQAAAAATSSGGSFVHVPLRPCIVPEQKEVLFVGFNQNYSQFLCGTESGFKAYRTDTFEETASRLNWGQGGVAIVEVLYKTKEYALVGGGNKHIVLLYDERQDYKHGELAFRSAVRAVRLVPNYIVVVTEFKVYVYVSGLRKIYEFETLSNIQGVVATAAPNSMDPNSNVLACLSHQRTGEVRIKKFNRRGSYYIQAHEEPLAFLALNSSGTLLATASTRGTIINIFRTSDGTKLQELRRGGDPAVIYSIAFSVNSRWLALSSSKDTVHVFSIKAEEQHPSTKLMASESGSRRFFRTLSSAAATAGSSLSFVKGMMPSLFISERSLCQFRLPKQSRAKVGFGLEKNTILIVCTDGSLYKCSFDPVKGGPCRLLQDFYFP